MPTIEFLVGPSDSSPKTLAQSIRAVKNASAGFCRSWANQETQDAIATSEEAFLALDHIQNELLRRRDKAAAQANWSSSPLKVALDQIVGELIEPASAVDVAHFLSCQKGMATMPMVENMQELRLAVALNKLKHRSTNAVNFTATVGGSHVLHIFTQAGMGKPDSISTFDVQCFCKACEEASLCL